MPTKATIKYFLTTPALGSDAPRMTITTGAPDREGDCVVPEGGDFKNFLKNPVLCWVHDYKHIPIGRVTELQVQPGKGIDATWDWLENDDFAARVKNAYGQGCINASSIGFIPKESTPNGKGMDITRWEMLELTLCPIPMNPEAVRAFKSLDFAGDLDTDAKAVPANVSMKKAPIGQAWSAPSLEDFTPKTWDALTDAEKRHIAGHYAWADELPPTSFGDLKLPHHDPKTGAVNFRGVAAAAARMNQAHGINESAVKAHLAAHYKQFGKTAPWDGAKGLADAVAALKDYMASDARTHARDVGDATHVVNVLQGLASSELAGGDEHASHIRDAASHMIQFLQEEFAEQFGIAQDGSPDISDAEIHQEDEDGGDGSVMTDAQLDEPLIPLDDDSKYPFVSATGLTGEAKIALVKGINAAVSTLRQKRGRSLSAANEARLKNAHAHIKAAHNTVGDVLACVKDETRPTIAGSGGGDDNEGGDADGMIALSFEDDDMVLDLGDDEPRLTLDVKDAADAFDVDPAALRAALAAVIRESLGKEVTAAMQVAVDRARGRVVV